MFIYCICNNLYIKLLNATNSIWPALLRTGKPFTSCSYVTIPM